MVRFSGLAALAAVFTTLLSPAPASAGVLYATGFESPTYTSGGIAGQDGWSTFGTAALANVQGSVAASGTQAVRVEGAATGQTGPWRSISTAETLLSVSADILLTTASQTGGWQFAGLGAGLSGFAGGVDITGTSIRAITAGFPVIGTLVLDTWNHIEILLDFGTQTSTLLLNGSTLASGIAFCGDNGPCGGAAVAQLGSVIFDTFGGGQDTGYLDNVRIATVNGTPEPATLALVAAGLAGLALPRARRRAQATR